MAFEPLRTALEKSQVVRFSYLKPGESESRVRTVLPLALVQHEGRWHLSAVETGTGARKTFLLRRIVSAVHPTGVIEAPRAGDHSDEALRELDEVFASHTAQVVVTGESDAATRLSKRRGARAQPDGVIELHFTDLNIVADELASFGPEVIVRSPPALRSAVRDRLERIALDHGPSTQTEPSDG